MPSKRKIAPVVSRDGISGVRGASRDQDIAVIELDATFGRVLGLADGQKVADYIIGDVNGILTYTLDWRYSTYRPPGCSYCQH